MLCRSRLSFVARRAYVCFAVPLALLSLSATARPDTPFGAIRAADDLALVEQIIADWRERSEVLTTMRCVAEGTITTPRGCYNGSQYVPDDPTADFPAVDHTYPCRYDWLFDFGGGRLRTEKHREAFYSCMLDFIPYADISAFDGKSTTLHIPRDRNTSDRYSPDPRVPEYFFNAATAPFETLDLTLLLAHGTVPVRSGTFTPLNMRSALPQPVDFLVDGIAEYSGRPCVALRYACGGVDAHYELWVDVARQSAIVHFEFHARGTKRWEIDFDYEQELAGVWLPANIAFIKYRPQPENPPEILCKMKVIEMAVNCPVSTDDFAPQPPKDAIVRDYATYRRPVNAQCDARLSEAGYSLGFGAGAFIPAAVGLVWYVQSKREKGAYHVVVRGHR